MGEGPPTWSGGQDLGALAALDWSMPLMQDEQVSHQAVTFRSRNKSVETFSALSTPRNMLEPALAS